MLDISTILWLIAGFGFMFVVGTLLGAGTDTMLAGLFPQSGGRDWPVGVQESDVPRFAVEHLDTLRPTVIGLVLGFGFLIAAGVQLSAGSHLSLAGLFPVQAVRDWPHGVQEPDAPRFDVAHLDELRPARTPVANRVLPDDDAERPEIVELGVRRIDRRP